MGEWRELDRRWFELDVVNCDLCGRVLGRRAWTIEDDGEERRLCGEKCEELYFRYWRPRMRRRMEAGRG
jgi:ribosomal protein L24E